MWHTRTATQEGSCNVPFGLVATDLLSGGRCGGHDSLHSAESLPCGAALITVGSHVVVRLEERLRARAALHELEDLLRQVAMRFRLLLTRKDGVQPGSDWGLRWGRDTNTRERRELQLQQRHNAV